MLIVPSRLDPPERYPPTQKPGYILRTNLVKPYKKGMFKIRNRCSIKAIEGDKLFLTDGAVLHPSLLIAATGWSMDYSFLPGGNPPGVRYKASTLASTSRTPRPMYARFYDQEYPGIFYVSAANGFMAAGEGASFHSQCVEQILRGEWTPIDESFGCKMSLPCLSFLDAL